MERHPLPGSEIPFETARNFRELGGYETADGRHVKYGLLYRGVALSGRMNEADRKRLSDMRLKYVLDLRAKAEADADPDVVPEGALYERICGMKIDENEEFNFSPEEIANILKRDPGKMDQMLRDLYRGMPLDNPAFKRLFEKLEEGCVPVLFHCSAGKDRTGTAALLILLALGVDQETAIEDYLLTNVYRKKIIDAEAAMVKKQFPDLPEFAEMISAKEGVKRFGAEAVLEVILHTYGTVEAYLEAEFGLDEERLNAFRSRYLE